MAELAIKGDKDRGNEVIALLKMLGGWNYYRWDAKTSRTIYFINDGIIEVKTIRHNTNINEFNVFTIEEFEEKYPYKVGDKVMLSGSLCTITKMWWDDINNDMLYMVQGKCFVVNADVNSLQPHKEQEIMKYKVGDKVKIKSLDWYNTNKDKEDGSYVDLIHTTSGNYNFVEQMCEFCGKIVTIKEVYVHNLCYDIVEDDGAFCWTDDMIECLVEHVAASGSINTSVLTITNEEVEKHKIQIPEFPQSINLSQSNVNEIEVVLGDYEFVLKDGKTYFVKKKSVYPKTYEECCECLSLGEDSKLYTKGYKASLIQDFQKLYICRNAYWKIAGEELGLDKPWKPDYNDCTEEKYFSTKFFIYVYRDEICHGSCELTHHFLTFPTAEMRDIFYENFKSQIEECKELL